MRFRIRTRHDISWPLGWAAAALAVAGILTVIYSTAFDDLGNTSPDPASWVVAQVLWLGGGLAALLTLCIAPLTTPTGRGWKPALGALGITLLAALSVLGQGG